MARCTRVTVLLLLVLAALAVPAAAQAAGPPVVRGSVEQVQVTGATPRRVACACRPPRPGRRDAGGRARSAASCSATSRPGGGYRVQAGGTASRARVRVLSTRSAPPSTAPYDQTIPAEGYGYLTTRDGTKLAVDVQLPGPIDKGPYPDAGRVLGLRLRPPAGRRERASPPIGNLLGFAVVDVNMRGTGCSGGAFDYFEPLQALDGYDVIETVARQPLGRCTTRSG